MPNPIAVPKPGNAYANPAATSSRPKIILSTPPFLKFS